MTPSVPPAAPLPCQSAAGTRPRDSDEQPLRSPPPRASRTSTASRTAPWTAAASRPPAASAPHRLARAAAWTARSSACPWADAEAVDLLPWQDSPFAGPKPPRCGGTGRRRRARTTRRPRKPWPASSQALRCCWRRSPDSAVAGRGSAAAPKARKALKNARALFDFGSFRFPP
eukprot:scaffold1070_cov245-Pinguiococcus_pyrenoidosus.AAC.44